jgi:hypothetical protein
MVSPTTQTKTRRHNRDQKLGVKRKRFLKRNGTPAFPLDPESGITSNEPAAARAPAK